MAKLDADDRTGSSAAGETLFVNLDHLAQIRRVLVFAFIYEGTPAWEVWRWPWTVRWDRIFERVR